jgi:hypothetical protein
MLKNIQYQITQIIIQKKKEKEKIRKLINLYNKNKNNQLIEDNKKTIFTYITHQYYIFNNNKNSLNTIF